LNEGIMVEVASALLGDQAVLYKEKINYKLAGGAGYAPHQDAPAYRFVDIHLSCMVAIDDSTIENGCLEVVSGAHQAILPMDDQGCIAAPVVAGMNWFWCQLRSP
jgi:ectoine hydroxylase-related dioxygenase (phytanoyl-CoA dioxygenase family)